MILASFADAAERVRALDSGADDVVQEPFAFSELAPCVRVVLRRATRGSQTILRLEDDDFRERGAQKFAQISPATRKNHGYFDARISGMIRFSTRTQAIVDWRLARMGRAGTQVRWKG